MSIFVLPELPPIPSGEATPQQWDIYLRIAALYAATNTAQAIDAQTAQMVKMVAASERHAALMQQLLDQPASPTPTSSVPTTGVAMTDVLELVRIVLERPEST